jgi:phosphotransferase system enzyme I (PtsI)
VCEVGGPTSHIAIVARSLEIPAVLGVEGVTEQAGDGDTVIVDGGAGQVLLTPDAQVLARYRGLRRAARHAARVVHDERDRPAVTLDGFHVAVRANIELVDELPTVLEHGTEGVGLYRTEFLYIGRDELPGVDEQYENYRRVVEKVAPELVTIRTIDIGSEKLARSLPIDPEPNPALGLRAIRFCLKRPDIFRAQLRAILMASAHGPVRILLPMISSVEELREARALLDAVKGDLRTDGLPFDPHVKLGVMIELPSACVIADLLARECDFFSLGTNDLIQYALAVDRNNEHLTHLYQPFHPAVLRMIAEVVAAGHAQHIPVGMCGEMAGDPAVLPLLLAFGLDELSMAAVAAPRIKREVRTLGLDECRALWQQVRRLATAAEIEAATRAFHEARAAAGGEP